MAVRIQERRKAMMKAQAILIANEVGKLLAEMFRR